MDAGPPPTDAAGVADAAPDASQPTDAGDVQTDAGSPSDAGPADDDVLVVVTLNTHSFQEGPDSLEKLQWIGAGLAGLGADVVGLNEVMSGDFWAYGGTGVHHDGATIIRAALEQASGMPWHATAFGFAHWSSGELMSNVILTKYPVVESDSRWLTTTDAWPGPSERRNAGYVRTWIPRVGWVNVFVTHAWGWSSADTLTQVQEVKAFMVDKFRGDEGLDLLLGDLNTPSTWSAFSSWLDPPPFRLVDMYGTAHPDAGAAPTTFDDVHRIDHVLAGVGWPLSEDPSRHTASLVFTGDGLLPRVSDHKGVAVVFQVGGP